MGKKKDGSIKDSSVQENVGVYKHLDENIDILFNHKATKNSKFPMRDKPLKMPDDKTEK